MPKKEKENEKFTVRIHRSYDSSSSKAKAIRSMQAMHGQAWSDMAFDYITVLMKPFIMAESGASPEVVRDAVQESMTKVAGFLQWASLTNTDVTSMPSSSAANGLLVEPSESAPVIKTPSKTKEEVFDEDDDDLGGLGGLLTISADNNDGLC